MKYIITESQYNRINEISVYEGGMGHSKSYENLFDVIVEKVGNKTFRDSVKDYLKNEMGDNPKKKDKEFSFKSYGKKIRGLYYGYDDTPLLDYVGTDLLSNMAYFLSKKFLRVIPLGTLECYIHKERGSREYYFFDPELQMSVGSIRLRPTTYCKKGNCWEVSLSGVDEEVKGSGVGKAMYSAVLDDVDILFSDDTLYTDSLNIWVNVLPKIAYVFALMNNAADNIKKILPKTKVLDHEKVAKYFATKNMDSLKYVRD